VNCMELQDPKSIYSVILSKLECEEDNEISPDKILQEYLTKERKNMM
jgi:Cdc6-like AAA superfamily ATPase